jgi:hypothetical protein
MDERGATSAQRRFAEQVRPWPPAARQRQLKGKPRYACERAV